MQYITLVSICLFFLFGCVNNSEYHVGKFNVADEVSQYASTEFAKDGNNKSLLFLLFYDDYTSEDIQSVFESNVARIMRTFYIFQSYKYGQRWRENNLKEYWREGRNYRGWEVSFDQYLQIKDTPLSREELTTLRKFGRTYTPAILIIDSSGRELYRREYEDEYEFPDSDEMTDLLTNYTILNR